MRRHYEVIIVGCGPAGIFAALELCRSPRKLRILMLEKGHPLAERKCFSREEGKPCLRCSPCHINCGWGGAGAFSDGKLTLSPEVGGFLNEYMGKDELQALITYIDNIYLAFGAPQKVYGADEEEIARIEQEVTRAELKFIPTFIRHLGTGKTQEILQNIYNTLSPQVEIETNTAVEKIITQNNTLQGLLTSKGEEIGTEFLVVAPGRQGAEWLAQESARLGLATTVNPVDLGIRVEVPAVVLEPLTNVVYEPKLLFYSPTFDDRVRTFCINPYGEVVEENHNGIITVNGHAYATKISPNTNFALLVSKSFTEPFREPIAYGKYIASLANLLGGGVLVQRLGDLLAGQRSTPERLKKSLVTPTLKSATPGDLSLVFPYRFLTAFVEMLRAFDKVAPGVYARHSLLYGVEAKFYSSRLELSPDLETKIPRLYAAGDGAGVTRGLVQASISGVVAARGILKNI